jgi:hypothetical protein
MKILRVVSYVFLSMGVLLFTVGALFKIQHWPDIFMGLVTGPVAILIGVVLFMISMVRSKE